MYSAREHGVFLVLRPMIRRGARIRRQNTPSKIFDPCMEVNVKQEMARYSLGYDKFNHFVYCSSCHAIISINFRRHLREIHNVNVPTKIFHLINEFLLQDTLITSTFKFIKNADDIKAFSYLEKFDGLKCISCYYCCVKESSMKKHYCGNEKSVVRKTVQSLNAKNNASYFSVRDERLPSNITKPTVNTGLITAKLVIDSKSIQKLPYETIGGLSKVYSTLEWFHRNDPFWDLDYEVLLNFPIAVNETFFELNLSLLEIFKTMMRSITNIPLSIRIFITAEGKEFNAKAFKSLQEESSDLKYCKFYVKVFFVLIRLVLQGGDSFYISQSIKDKVNEMIIETNRIRLQKVVLDICWMLIIENSSTKGGLGLLILIYIFKVKNNMCLQVVSILFLK